jgi:hypothetical protein
MGTTRAKQLLWKFPQQCYLIIYFHDCYFASAEFINDSLFSRNVVDSFTNYLEKLDKDVKTVSVNVKGIETVFRLTPKRKPDNSN